MIDEVQAMGDGNSLNQVMQRFLGAQSAVLRWFNHFPVYPRNFKKEQLIEVA